MSDIEKALDVAIAAKLAAQRAGEEPEVWAVDAVEDEVEGIVTVDPEAGAVTHAADGHVCDKSNPDCASYLYYADPKNRAIPADAVPHRRTRGPNLSRITPVRFDPDTMNAVSAIAAAEEMTASAWIRRAVKRQLDHEDV